MTLARRPPPIGVGATPVPDPPAILRLFGQRGRAAWRALALLAWTLPGALLQALLILLPGQPKRWFARVYWAVVARLLGIERRIIGDLASRPGGRPVLFVSNHTSWLDIPTLGGVLPACFVAKAEVSTWPIVRTIAALGRTVFVSRRPSETGRERDDIRARLSAGDNLILFPEGTSSDGVRVLPFRSPFFAVVEASAAPPLIQPVSIVYDRLDGLAMLRATRPVAAWYGDMGLAQHFWRLAAYRRLRATIVLHPPIDPADHPSRKALARHVWTVVATAAAALRQGRAATPAATPVSLDRVRPVIAKVAGA